MEKANTNDRMWGKLETRSQLESGEDTPPREGLEKGYSPVTVCPTFIPESIYSQTPIATQ